MTQPTRPKSDGRCLPPPRRRRPEPAPDVVDGAKPAGPSGVRTTAETMLTAFRLASTYQDGLVAAGVKLSGLALFQRASRVIIRQVLGWDEQDERFQLANVSNNDHWAEITVAQFDALLVRIRELEAAVSRAQSELSEAQFKHRRELVEVQGANETLRSEIALELARHGDQVVALEQAHAERDAALQRAAKAEATLNERTAYAAKEIRETRAEVSRLGKLVAELQMAELQTREAERHERAQATTTLARSVISMFFEALDGPVQQQHLRQLRKGRDAAYDDERMHFDWTRALAKIERKYDSGATPEHRVAFWSRVARLALAATQAALRSAGTVGASKR